MHSSGQLRASNHNLVQGESNSPQQPSSVFLRGVFSCHGNTTHIAKSPLGASSHRCLQWYPHNRSVVAVWPPIFHTGARARTPSTR